MRGEETQGIGYLKRKLRWDRNKQPPKLTSIRSLHDDMEMIARQIREDFGHLNPRILQFLNVFDAFLEL